MAVEARSLAVRAPVPTTATTGAGAPRARRRRTIRGIAVAHEAREDFTVYPPAPHADRFAAAWVDFSFQGTVLTLVQLPFDRVLSRLATLPHDHSATLLKVLLWIVAAVAYAAVPLLLKGQTLGKLAFGLRVVRAGDGGNVRLAAAVAREVVLKPLALVLVFVALFTPEQRTVHDVLSGTRVVSIRRYRRPQR